MSENPYESPVLAEVMPTKKRRTGIIVAVAAIAIILIAGKIATDIAYSSGSTDANAEQYRQAMSKIYGD
jgi:hypothetical protein